MNREYPKVPLIGVGIIVKKNEYILLVNRANEPKKGLWSIPGGRVRLGESIREAAEREVLEECAIHIRLSDVVSVVDLIDKDDNGKVKYHYVLIDFMAEYERGDLKAGSDALDAKWVMKEELNNFDIPDLTRKVIAKVA
jgi:8-oxo-dGTP diphosphatase